MSFKIESEGDRWRSDAGLMGHFKDRPAYASGSIMPSVGNLTRTQLRALTLFPQNQKVKPESTVSKVVRTRRRSMSVSWLLPAVLSTTAGAVDIISFLALGGLFTAHITGNLVVLAAHYVTGGFSQNGPLLSVPVFVVVLGAVTLAFGTAREMRSTRRALLILHAVLLGLFLVFSTKLGPVADPGGAPAVYVGMLGVAGMAIQNALVKLALPGSPSTAVLTTNTTLLAIDLATLAHARSESGELVRARRRASVILLCIVGFVIGCAAGAFLEVRLHLSALALPFGLAVLAVPLGELWPE